MEIFLRFIALVMGVFGLVVLIIIVWLMVCFIEEEI